MKKIILTLLVAITFTATYSQNKYQERQTAYFVNAAGQEFELDKKQQKELTEIRTTMVLGYMESNEQHKNGEITEDEKKEKNKETSKEFHNAIVKLTGKSYKELEPFLDRMRLELKNVK
jgi:hypothetical protein